MNQKLLLRIAVAALLALLLWLGWRQVTPPERLGDVPYVPTRAAVVDRMLELAEVDGDDLVFDLGSGDGRIVIRAAQRFGARARGYELDPLLVRASRASAVRAGVEDRVEFIAGDLFDADLHDATAVTLFLLPTVNLALRPRLLAELAPGTPVVSHMWDMGEWRPDTHEVIELEPPAEVFRWIVPAAAGGVWEIDRLDPAEASLGDHPIGLRILQRFQDVEGELVYRDAAVPVAGTVRGSELELEATRDLPDGGRFTLSAAIDGDALVGRMLGGGGSAAVPLSANRVPARLEGSWQVGAAGEPFAPQWSLTLARAGDRWTARRTALEQVTPRPGATSLPGIAAPMAGAPDGQPAAREAMVWGASIAVEVGAADGSARRIIYYGLVQGDRISGFVQDGGTLIPWQARRVDGAGEAR
jgi:SAM-dependent methyltransferase